MRTPGDHAALEMDISPCRSPCSTLASSRAQARSCGVEAGKLNRYGQSWSPPTPSSSSSRLPSRGVLLVFSGAQTSWWKLPQVWVVVTACRGVARDSLGLSLAAGKNLVAGVAWVANPWLSRRSCSLRSSRDGAEKTRKRSRGKEL